MAAAPAATTPDPKPRPSAHRSNRRSDSCRRFDGVRVLELGQIYNGPYCGLLFAQLGADVIKVEPPGGEPLRFRSHDPVESHEFVMLNSNKRSVVLDLKTDAGRQALLDLVETADVLIENFAPGTMERLQLSPARLLAHNPRLVVASGKGYGSTGPYAHMSAMDITVQAMSGAASATGEPDGPPTKSGAAFVDFSGGIHLFAAITAALFQRERTGRGQIVEVSMHDTIYPMLASSLGGLHNNPDRAAPRAHREPALGHGGRAVQHLPDQRRMAGDHLHLRAALARRGNRAGPARADRRPPVPHDERTGSPTSTRSTSRCRRSPGPAPAPTWSGTCRPPACPARRSSRSARSTPTST